MVDASESQNEEVNDVQFGRTLVEDRARGEATPTWLLVPGPKYFAKRSIR